MIKPLKCWFRHNFCTYTMNGKSVLMCAYCGKVLKETTPTPVDIEEYKQVFQ